MMPSATFVSSISVAFSTTAAPTMLMFMIMSMIMTPIVQASQGKDVYVAYEMKIARACQLITFDFFSAHTNCSNSVSSFLI
jgi:hypothetical protein